nr:hypothetical protein [Candidatus Enterousia merdequi]
MKRYFLLFFAICFVFNANAAIKVKNNTEIQYGQQIAEENNISGDEAEIIATLENDIKILDEEIAKCEKQKKGWIAATVIGSIGLVSTGIAAGVQGAKIKEKKDDLSSKKKELKDLKQESNDLSK